MPGELPLYADVLLPLAVPQYYTYRVPEILRLSVHEGCRITVPLGKRKKYTGIVRRLHSNHSEGFEIRDIEEILDTTPVVSELQLSFWEWLAGYYMCTPGEVYKAALPSGLKLESETRIYARDGSSVDLNNYEYLLNQLVEENPGITLHDLSVSSGKIELMPILKGMIEKGVISLEENVRENYKPKFRERLTITEEFRKEDRLQELLSLLEKKAPKQAVILIQFISIGGFVPNEDTFTVAKEELLKLCNTGLPAINALLKKGVLQLKREEVSRLAFDTNEVFPPKELNSAQKTAYHEIKEHFIDKEVVLLHGVTSSGKTEIYIHLISQVIQQGKQVLYLVPEIALTTQIIHRLRRVFGNRIGIYHSKFSDAERVEVYLNLTGMRKADSPEYQIILGVRSSIFLPFSQLGLIIVDEEHESTYKQYDPAPRYNARDAAVMLAGMHKAKVLLGTATPSFESYLNAHVKRYGLVELTSRYSDILLPEIEVVNVREARRKKKMHTHFSPQLLACIQQTLDDKQQVILFQNRRGFSPYIECVDCGWVPHCKNCDVSLTYHKNASRLNCHYCGYSIANLMQCAQCGSTHIQTRGFGTEKVEDEMAIHFPEARLSRMDMDTTRTRKSYEKIIEDFENQKVDILIGTQMVSKGLDFDHVKVVGILNADNMLNFPDFRAYERSFQLIAQVSGRAGRKNERGKVILQTGDPENTVLQFVLQNDFKGFFLHQLDERLKFKYPPYYRLIKLTLRHRQLILVSKAANSLAANLRKEMGERIVGPEFPLINRIFNLHQKCILVKLERDKLFSSRRKFLTEAIAKIQLNDEFKGIQIVPDVDPYN